MGLDLAEVMMDVEDAFGIRLDEHASWDGTVGGLVSLVEATDARQPTMGSCHSGFVFRRLRRALLIQADDGSQRVRPSTAIDALANRRILARRWREVELDAGLALPSPEPTRPRAYAIGGALGGLALIAPFWVAAGWAWHWWIAIAALASAVLATVMLPTSIPARFHTVGDLVRVAVGMNQARLRREMGPPRRSEIQEVVQGIIASRLNVPLAQVTLRAHLIRDLGAD